jgi:hypothetical protein
MSNGVLHPNEVRSITDSLEISPSKSSPGDIIASRSVQKEIHGGKSSAGSGAESPFKMKPNGHKGPRR